MTFTDATYGKGEKSHSLTFHQLLRLLLVILRSDPNPLWYSTDFATPSMVGSLSSPITLIALFLTNGQDMDHICRSPFFTPNVTV